MAYPEPMLATLLALLAALPQADPPEREQASGFTFVRPKGWSRQEAQNNSVAILPPGPDGQQCSIFILAGSDGEAPEPEFHEKMFQGVTQGGKPEGTIERATVGGWQASRLKFITAQEQPSWISLYTIRSGTRLEAVLFVAATEELFKTHRPAVERMVAGAAFPKGGKAAPAPAARPAGAAIHGLIIPVPRDWARKEDPSGGVQLIPPQILGVLQYFLFVLPPNRFEGTHWDAHRAMVKALLDQAKWTGGEPVVVPKPEGPGLFIRTEAAGRTAAGEGRTFTLYTAAHDGIMEAVLGVNALDRNVTDPVLQATTFAIPPKSDPRPKVVEAYRRITQRLYNTRDGGPLAAGSLLYDRLWLLSNGVADFSTIYLEGYAASTLPMKVDSSLRNGDFGSWKAVGDAIHVQRFADGKVEVYERRNGGLRGDGKDWEPMPRVDGLKLSGRWEIKSPPEEKISPYHDWIEFTPEGRFKVEGVLKSVATGDGMAKPPERGAGKYELRDWTMFFAFDDGTTWSTDFSVLGREITPEMSILFRTSVYPKAK